jgi:hypothetical protein
MIAGAPVQTGWWYLRGPVIRRLGLFDMDDSTPKRDLHGGRPIVYVELRENRSQVNADSLLAD